MSAQEIDMNSWKLHSKHDDISQNGLVFLCVCFFKKTD